VKEVSSDEIERAVFSHFNNYVLPTEEDSKSTSFEVYSDFSKRGKSGIDIFYHTLNKIFDASKDQLDKHLQNYIVEFAKSKVIESKQLGCAICKYLREYADRVVDFPLLKVYLARLVAALIVTDSTLKP
jgi:Zn-dependent M16 (insulinase) family peptidase